MNSWIHSNWKSIQKEEHYSINWYVDFTKISVWVLSISLFYQANQVFNSLFLQFFFFIKYGLFISSFSW
jgi:hypothetical protein